MKEKPSHICCDQHFLGILFDRVPLQQSTKSNSNFFVIFEYKSPAIVHQDFQYKSMKITSRGAMLKSSVEIESHLIIAPSVTVLLTPFCHLRIC